MIWKRCCTQKIFHIFFDLPWKKNSIFHQNINVFYKTNIISRSMASYQNKLVFEKSPYLLQHASNPVNWYPWGEEALELARKENKIIFLSIGYSTCHWCHVMEKESFENSDVAKIMNEHFVNIKVDREERPDIDKVYMTFIQSISGHGGWPLSIFLTPDLTPLTGGTYFPPYDKYGQPGFTRLLQSVANKWKEKRTDLLESSKHIFNALRSSVQSKLDSKEPEVPSIDCAVYCVEQLSKRYENKFGGFSKSPKFPQPVNLNLLMLMYARDPTSEIGKKCLQMCDHTLTKMAYGGIHDHVGHGFARYSVDDKWHVPHFEKMLYDQGQLLRSYSEMYIATKNLFFADVANDIVSYAIRDLRHPEGGFYSAEDADSLEFNSSEKKEGAFYVWKYDTITSLLNKKISESDILLSDIFSYYYNIKSEGNIKPYQDPHGELQGQNILIIYENITKAAEHFQISEENLKNYLKEGLKILFDERKKRPRPHLDDKFITAWNGLMISGLSYAALALENSKYVEYAEEAARFIEKYLFDKERNILLRSCYRGKENQILQQSVAIKGFQVDYAFVIQAMLDLYEATFNTHWLELAEKLQDIQDNLFWDKESGAYFTTTADDSSVILRLKDDQDGAEPSGNSVASKNLLRLSAYLNRRDLAEKAEKLFSALKEMLNEFPIACPELVCGLIYYQDSLMQVYVIGNIDGEDCQRMLSALRSCLLPGKIIIATSENDLGNKIFSKNSVISKMKSINGKATAYVCRNRVCSLPIEDPDELVSFLKNKES